MADTRQTPHYLTDEDLASRYGVARTSIWRWANEGHFPRPIKLAPSTTRWRSDEVAEWEARRARRAAG